MVNNAVFSSVSEIFDDKAKFLWESENIAKHLLNLLKIQEFRVENYSSYTLKTKEKAQKEWIKSNFQTEKRESFLKISPNQETFDIEKDQESACRKLIRLL